MLTRRLLYSNIVIQCDADTTPEHLREHDMVCAILTWMPERNDAGQVIAEGFFNEPDTKSGDERVKERTVSVRELPAADAEDDNDT